MCSGATTMEEKNADLFASVLLLPREGVYAMLCTDEILQHDVKLATILRIEQLFQVSRSMLLIRLKDIGVISENKRQELQMIPVKESAMNYGYDKSLYESGNDGVFIGDFGEKARLLFETGKISRRQPEGPRREQCEENPRGAECDPIKQKFIHPYAFSHKFATSCRSRSVKSSRAAGPPAFPAE